MIFLRNFQKKKKERKKKGEVFKRKKNEKKIYEKKISKRGYEMIHKAIICPKFWAHSKKISNQESPRS